MVSITIAVILLTLLASFTTSRMDLTASIVESSDVEPLNVMKITVSLSLYNLSCISSGNISYGIVVPKTSAILHTSLTFFISFIFSSRANICSESLSFVITKAYEPRPNSSVKMFSPFIVSIVFGK